MATPHRHYRTRAGVRPVRRRRPPTAPIALPSLSPDMLTLVAAAALAPALLLAALGLVSGMNALRLVGMALVAAAGFGVLMLAACLVWRWRR